MRISRLQRAMLLACYPARGWVARSRFALLAERAVTRAKDPTDVITKALERLTDRGLLTAYGRRTRGRWYIERVRLTPEGRRAAVRYAGTQQELPLDTSQP